MSTWGRRGGRLERRWSVREADGGFVLTTAAGEQTVHGEDLADLAVQISWWRGGLALAGGPRLTGLRRRDAVRLDAAVAGSLARHRVELAVNWRAAVLRTLEAAVQAQRWVPVELRQELERAKPRVDPGSLLGPGRPDDGVRADLTDDEREALAFLHTDVASLVATTNERVLEAETRSRRDFFDRVESRPLTAEQACAVVSLDNRVLVVAAAGSGKTSVMVARAAYAVHRGFVRPERILLLAFNKDAARELQDRVRARFRALGLSDDGIRATTFHAFGLDVIGRATGRKPRAASWLLSGEDSRVVEQIVDELRDASAAFRYRWDLFRLLYARAADDDPAGGEPDASDPQQRRSGFRTARDEVVQSEGERLIADWLYFHGVPYEYERPYRKDVANAEHGQYRPDFYYPTVQAWHEHWAIGHDGRPPVDFDGYAESMAWKRRLHAQHGTTLIETTWAEVVGGTGLLGLEEQLSSLGVELDWNPDRPVKGTPPLAHGDLASLVLKVMKHVKGNALTREDLRRRVAERGRTSTRTQLFLQVYWDVHDAWQARLQAEDCVDFEDMLVQAAEHLEQGRARPEHELVLVDEFQDASQARARLTRALVGEPGSYLLAVGDDWQSINRFAGADLSVMTHFHELFGEGPTLHLQTTFRCSQELADVASAFVQKNPRQLDKSVVAAAGRRGAAPVKAVQTRDAASVPQAVSGALEALAARVRRGEAPPGEDGRVSVQVLGRYRSQRDVVPARLPRELDVTFRTVHSSKGLEADYVIVPHLVRGRLGFPSGMADDPLLDLVMVDPDTYPHAEERRLFYVALTRARREVLLVTVAGQESSFLAELVGDGHVRLDLGGVEARSCPSCAAGFLTSRTGPRGTFFGCTRFPACRHTASSAPPGPRPPAGAHPGVTAAGRRGRR